MKLPPFDHDKKQWDCFKAFHVIGGNRWSVGYGHYQGDAGSCFVQFEDGSLMLNDVAFHNRQVHEKFGLAIGTPQELARQGAVFLQDNGDHMPTAWLYKNADNDTHSPTLVLDAHLKRAYAIHAYAGTNDSYARSVPAYARGGRVYWPMENAEPFSVGLVRVCKSPRYQNKEFKRYLDSLRPTAQAVLALDGKREYVGTYWISRTCERVHDGASWSELVEAAENETKGHTHLPSAPVLAATAVLRVKAHRPRAAQGFVHVDIRNGSELSRI